MPRMGDLAATDAYSAFDVPLEQTYDRRLDQTWPGQLVQDAIGAVLAPGRALQSTEPITTEQMIKPAADLAGLVTGGSYAAPAQRGASGAGIRAYHSSPHDFDKFDLAKIGTGEGAQVYGHGLYFAESPAVSGQGGQYWQQFQSKFEGTPEGGAAERLLKAKFDRERAAESIRAELANDRHPYRHILEKQLGLLESGQPVGPRTYEVNINADPAHMLDWDKPLREQPQAIATRRAAQGVKGWSGDPTATPQSYIENLSSRLMDSGLGAGEARAAVSERLREAGIPGIKYLDEGSRGVPTVGTGRVQAAGSGKFNIVDDFGIQAGPFPTLEQAQQYLNPGKKLTSNYVIFDPNIIRIDKKYVIPGAAAGMGALAAQDQYRE